MSSEEVGGNGGAEKIGVLNEIFEDVISDTSELVKDLSWSVKTYLFFGLIMILFGISEIAYTAEVMQERYYLPLFVAGTLIFAGAAQVYNYFRLRRKYSKLFSVQDELRKT